MSDAHEMRSKQRPTYRTETLDGFVVHFVDFGKPWATACRYHAQIDLPGSDACWFVNGNDEADVRKTVLRRIARIGQEITTKSRASNSTDCAYWQWGMGGRKCGTCPACQAAGRVGFQS